MAGELLTEFLEVAIHVILFERKVYPEDIFTRQRAFGVPVTMSRHPDVNAYIKKVLGDARPLFDARAVESLVVAVTDGGGEPRERFVFDVGLGGGAAPSPEAVEATEYAMRALLAKLADPRVVAPFAASPESGYVDARRDAAAAPLGPGFDVVPVRDVATPLAEFALRVEVAA
ncbi:hypothetical protein JL721_90 [Aureococcus anophagefferens]|nr:hypothetical protein JL721_90 [Aureococcus anophagefferens]